MNTSIRAVIWYSKLGLKWDLVVVTVIRPRNDFMLLLNSILIVSFLVIISHFLTWFCMKIGCLKKWIVYTKKISCCFHALCVLLPITIVIIYFICVCNFYVLARRTYMLYEYSTFNKSALLLCIRLFIIYYYVLSVLHESKWEWALENKIQLIVAFRLFVFAMIFFLQVS